MSRHGCVAVRDAQGRVPVLHPLTVTVTLKDGVLGAKKPYTVTEKVVPLRTPTPTANSDSDARHRRPDANSGRLHPNNAWANVRTDADARAEACRIGFAPRTG